VKLPIIKSQFSNALAGLKDSAKYLADEKLQEEQVLNKPAAEWLLKDIDGEMHELKNYQGKVVILDFWYRGCGWCIRAMPQLKELADDFKDKPVVVLGMNTDRKSKTPACRRQIELNYPLSRRRNSHYHAKASDINLIDRGDLSRGRHAPDIRRYYEDSQKINAPRQRQQRFICLVSFEIRS
jgi:thiol-disulfide isomerase/thioredoxin